MWNFQPESCRQGEEHPDKQYVCSYCLVAIHWAYPIQLHHAIGRSVLMRESSKGLLSVKDSMWTIGTELGLGLDNLFSTCTPFFRDLTTSNLAQQQVTYPSPHHHFFKPSSWDIIARPWRSGSPLSPGPWELESHCQPSGTVVGPPFCPSTSSCLFPILPDHVDLPLATLMTFISNCQVPSCHLCLDCKCLLANLCLWVTSKGT